MEFFMGEEWQLRPAGGATGEAYVAVQGKHKLFIKRNSSPFLAILSAEGIVPKLLWTKRLENGDVITAQRWVDGRELKSYEMNDDRVASLISKIHRSRELLDMFKRMGNKPLTPRHLLANILKQSKQLEIKESYIIETLNWLDKNIPYLSEEDFVVCHADVNHNNWIKNTNETLFLIDWDGAQMADPALDLAPLLYVYVPKKDWNSWLDFYGEKLNGHLISRMRWYMIAICIENIFWFIRRDNDDERNKWGDLLYDIIYEVDHDIK